MRIRRHLVETIVKAARVTGIDPALLMAIADKESSFSTHVQAKTSSATGLFQFIERTWLQVVRDFGAKHGLAKEAAAVQWVNDELTVPDASRARAHSRAAPQPLPVGPSRRRDAEPRPRPHRQRASGAT